MTPVGQYELLRPLITPTIEKLARKRFIESRNLFAGERLTVRIPKHEVKVALLLVQIMNPFEGFSFEEEALLRGVSSKTLRLRKEHGRLSLNGRVR